MSRFPTPAHLCSWARFAPGVKQSAGKNKGRGATGHGNRYLGQALGEAAVAAARTHTFLGERYRRLARRRGGARATVAVGRSILVIIWHLLSEPDARYRDLGPDYIRRRTDPQPPHPQPRPPTRSPRLHRHPHTRRLTSAPTSTADQPSVPPRSRSPVPDLIFGLVTTDPREEFVHRHGAIVDDRAQLLAVDGLGDCRPAGVPDEARNLLDRHPFVGQQ